MPTDTQLPESKANKQINRKYLFPELLGRNDRLCAGLGFGKRIPGCICNENDLGT